MKLTSNVLPEHVFHFSGNGAIANLYEMVTTLQKASSADFTHHVNHQKNDIANWVAGAYGNYVIADALRQTTERQRIIQIIEEGLAAETRAIPSPHHEPPHTADHTDVHHHIRKVSQHVSHLQHSMSHLIKPHPKTDIPARHTHAELKRALTEFAFGLIIGLFIGLALAKVLGVA